MGRILRHLKAEQPVLVGKRGPMTSAVHAPALRSCAPNLDALPGKRSPHHLRGVWCHSSRSHPCRSDPPPCTLAVVVRTRPTSNRSVARPCARAGNRSETPVARTEPPTARRLRRSSTTVVMSNSSGDRAVAWRRRGRQQAQDALNLARLRPISKRGRAERDRSQ